MIGMEEEAPRREVSTAIKDSNRFANIDPIDLHNMLDNEQEDAAIEFLTTKKVNNIFYLDRVDQETGERENILQIAVKNGLTKFVRFLLEDYKVVSCIARATRNVNHCIITNFNGIVKNFQAIVDR